MIVAVTNIISTHVGPYHVLVNQIHRSFAIITFVVLEEAIVGPPLPALKGVDLTIASNSKYEERQEKLHHDTIDVMMK